VGATGLFEGKAQMSNPKRFWVVPVGRKYVDWAIYGMPTGFSEEFEVQEILPIPQSVEAEIEVLKAKLQIAKEVCQAVDDIDHSFDRKQNGLSQAGTLARRFLAIIERD
jgi:hypothetical protein